MNRLVLLRRLRARPRQLGDLVLARLTRARAASTSVAVAPPPPQAAGEKEDDEKMSSGLSRFFATATFDAETRRFFFDLARPERRRIALGLGLTLASASINLSVPFFVGQMLDVATGAESSLADVVGGPWNASAGLGALFVIQSGMM